MWKPKSFVNAMHFNGFQITAGFGMMLAVVAMPESASANNHVSFSDWQAELRTEALNKGISAKTFDTAFASIAPVSYTHLRAHET